MPKDFEKSIVGDKGRYSGSNANVLRKALRANEAPNEARNLRDAGMLGRIDPDEALKRVFGKEK